MRDRGSASAAGGSRGRPEPAGQGPSGAGRIDSPHNPLVQDIRRLAGRDERAARRLCLAEGPHLIAEAAAAGAAIETLCVADGHAGDLPPARRVVRVGDRVLQAIATTRTPQGVVAVVRIPEARDRGGLALAVDGLQDPGNLGTLLRVALAFGAGATALGPGTADPWSPKALRAAAGATFHLPPLAVGDLAAWLRARPGTCWSLVPRGGTPLPEAELHAGGAVTLVVGSEAHGVSAEVAACCRPLTIPMPGPAESLNAAVAAAVAAYEATRPRNRGG